MKKLAFLPVVLLLLTGMSACSQSRVPETVKTTFKKKFPSAQHVDWGREGKTEWEAEFRMNGKDMSANFDLHGHWKETETDLSVPELPASVQTELQQHFADYKIKEAAYTQTELSDMYEVIIKKGSHRLEITFDKQGKMTNEEAAGND
jgi:hypothetical protein